MVGCASGAWGDVKDQNAPLWMRNLLYVYTKSNGFKEFLRHFNGVVESCRPYDGSWRFIGNSKQ